MVLYRRFWLFFLTVYLLDLLTKSWIVGRAEGLTTNPIVIIDAIAGAPAFLKISYVTNPGAAWSMLSDYPEFLTVLAAVALILIFVFRHQLEISSIPQQLIFGSICGGIAGNLTDRIFRNPAEVVDFIDVYLPVIEYDYPVFNVADSGIFVGAIYYFFWSFFDLRNQSKESGQNELNSGQEIN